MSNNNPTAEQTKILQNFNNLLQERYDAEQKYQNLAQDINQVLDDRLTSLEDEIEKVEKLNDAFKAAGESIEKSSLNNFNKGLLQANAKIKMFTNSLNGISKVMQKGLIKKLSNITKSPIFTWAATGLGKLSGAIAAFAGVAVKALDAIAKHPIVAFFVAIIKKVQLLGKVLSTVFFGGIKYATRFVKFMVSLPLKIASAAAKIGNSLRNDLVMTIGTAVEATKEMFDISEQYGSGAGSAIKSFADSASASMLEFRDITSESVKLFGEGAAGIAARTQAMAQRLGEMGVYADIFGESLKASTDGSATQFTFMEKSLRILGMTAEDVAYVAQEAVKSGVGINKILMDTQISLKNVAKSSGVNAKMISKNFNVLRKDIINFGHMSTEQLQETSAALVKMGISAQDASSMFGKLDTFESSAQMAAMLSQSFGMNLDALKLIKAEDPKEIFEDLRQSMMATGRSFNELNRHEKSLMASTTGLSGASLKALMDFRDAGMSYEEAMQKMKENSPEAKQLKAFEDMTGSLKEIKNIMQDTSFMSAFFKGLRTSIVLASGLGDKFMKVSKRMQDFFIAGLDFGKDKRFMKSIRGAFKPIEDVIDKLVGKGGKDKGLFNVDLLQNAVKPFFKKFTDVLGSAFKDGANVLEIQENFSKMLNNAFDFQKFLSSPSNPAATLFKTGGKLVGQLLKGFAAVGPGLIDLVDKGFSGVVDFLIGYKEDTGENSLSTMLMDIFGLSNKDSLAIRETFNKLIDVLVGETGPFMRLFSWVNRKMFGLVVDLASIAAEAFMKSVPVLNWFTSDYTSNMKKGQQEASQMKLKGTPAEIKRIAKEMDEYESEYWGINDNEEELARLGGQLQYVVSAIEKSGSKKDKARMKEFFEKANISKSKLLDVRTMEENVEEVMDLYRFLNTGTTSGYYDDVEFKKSNDVWDDFASLFGYGKQAIVKVKNGKTEINQLNANDKVLAGMKGGDIDNAISEYAGMFTMNVLNGIASDLMKTTFGGNQQSSQSSVNQQSERPIELVVNLDGKVVSQQLVAADIIGIAKNPAYARGATVLGDGTTRNQSGGSNESAAV